ncbi:DUF5114 domain-containing protein [Prevotella sp. A2931]|uniref:DUF5114 domain-containing protein n=2 Tax=Prevotella TaxID=838 RepID=A0ABS3M2C4_9BACT|nr:DUF5114 domain-containing protein [Prevotella illustrans]PTL26450.1 DUF5114 domain-containing protein [Prevotella sp. oral taxon 820]
MKTLRHILFMVTALVLAVACTADGDLTATSGPDALTLSGSGDAVLSAKAKASLALTLHWNDNSKMKTNDRRVLLPDYATVNTLQFSASDNFAESVDQPLNKGETSRQYTVEELNSIAGRVGLEGDKASPLYVRVRSTLADNMPPTYSNTYTMRVTPYTIDMTRGVVLNSGREDTGLLLASKAFDGVYSGFLGVTGWWNYYLQEGNGVVWGNDGVTGTPFAMSSADSKWNFWYPGLEGCYYTVVDTRNARWSALHVSSLDVSGDITGQLVYNRKANRWTLAFDAAASGTITIRIAGKGEAYNFTTGTDDAKAIARTVAFAQENDGLVFGSTPGDIMVAIAQKGPNTLTLDLSDPYRWTCVAETGGAVQPETSRRLYLSGIDDGVSGKWTFDNYLTLYNEDELSYAGLCDVNSKWGYKFYPEKDVWNPCYGLGSGDAATGTLVLDGNDNVPAPQAGLYLVTASLKKLSYTTTPVTSVQLTGIGDDWSLVQMEATARPGVYRAVVKPSAATP